MIKVKQQLWWPIDFQDSRLSSDVGNGRSIHLRNLNCYDWRLLEAILTSSIPDEQEYKHRSNVIMPEIPHTKSVWSLIVDCVKVQTQPAPLCIPVLETTPEYETCKKTYDAKLTHAWSRTLQTHLCKETFSSALCFKQSCREIAHPPTLLLYSSLPWRSA